jgi:hypothetical protein
MPTTPQVVPPITRLCAGTSAIKFLNSTILFIQWMILSIQKTTYRMAKHFLYNLEDVVNL